MFFLQIKNLISTILLSVIKFFEVLLIIVQSLQAYYSSMFIKIDFKL